MRGEERRQRAILMIMEPGDRGPKEHPLRRVKELADAALAQLSALFDEMYSAIGRRSIPPERLLKASLLMALYTVRSERLFCEQLDYNPVVSLVPRYGCGRAELRPLELLAQPGTAAGARRGARVFHARGRAGPQSAVALGRTLHRGWHAGRSLGRRSRVSSARIGNRASRPTTPATRRLTSTASAAATRRISRPPTRKRSWRRRARARKRSCVTRPMR